ncbi:MAG: UPF0182 family protein, partial [Dehalococcoidia bacterium]
EKTNNYIIVNTNTEEFDYPLGEENIYTEHAAGGGVPLSSFFRRVAYASHLGDFNVLISGEINSGSRIL